MNHTLPTLYQYYTLNEIQSGLTTEGSKFLLNGKQFSIYGGSVHYFRVPREYWKDRLTKLKATGLNTVETYIPWNLHEPAPEVYDFGSGGTDFESFLDLRAFFEAVQEADLFAVVRPGPYICAEWEFGGLPSWLLRNEGIEMRTKDERFMLPVRRYFRALFSILTALQFVKGGPIIAFQIENEYPQGYMKDVGQSLDYMIELKQIFDANGVKELMLTSNQVSDGYSWKIPGVLYTANMCKSVKQNLRYLANYQPDKPLFVMEFWTGWYDSWSVPRENLPINNLVDNIAYVLSTGASINFYMFHGGTNFGFMNGASSYQNSTSSVFMHYLPVTNSYDYNAPLTESGDYTEKYHKIEEFMTKYSTVKTLLPAKPAVAPKRAYDPINITFQITLLDILQQSKCYRSSDLIPMELLPINRNAGQSYGYIVYRKRSICVPSYSTIKIQGYVKDTVMILINGELISPPLTGFNNEFGTWGIEESILQTDRKNFRNAILDIVIENYGRKSYGKIREFDEYKGLWRNNITINDIVIRDWCIYPLEFKKSWTKNLFKWKKATFPLGPTLYKAIFRLNYKFDSYIDMRPWEKGIIIVNGFILSRYLKIGPQQTAYLPAPLLKEGLNVILIFEQFVPHTKVIFSKKPIFRLSEKYSIVTPLTPAVGQLHSIRSSSDSTFSRLHFIVMICLRSVIAIYKKVLLH